MNETATAPKETYQPGFQGIPCLKPSGLEGNQGFTKVVYEKKDYEKHLANALESLTIQTDYGSWGLWWKSSENLPMKGSINRSEFKSG